MSDDPRAGTELDALVAVVEALLADEGGCEWNRAQTHASLVTYLVEETAELVEAIETGTSTDMREELGDVLYQVVLHAALATRASSAPVAGGERFDVADVIRDVTAKTVRRHPHVFGDDVVDGVDDIVRVWSAAKAREKADRRSAFDGVPLGLPALARAQKIESRGAAAGIEADGELPPASGELAWGRSLLALVDEAGRSGVDAERALRAAVREREESLRSAEADSAT
ncbi:MazG nucleotide pyrophosphohydrolase domain-containing protein [Frigoribacterium sp. 2-23]|uniref:MazG nucleotide pyrophosphohydrolase domain-containing protein n=1 Tax=Frigoribacterium sp. 2-23 TaxID=3415006 RepID=UPI003C6FBD38